MCLTNPINIIKNNLSLFLSTWVMIYFGWIENVKKVLIIIAWSIDFDKYKI